LVKFRAVDWTGAWEIAKALGFGKSPLCAGLETAPFVFCFVLDTLVEPNGLLVIPAEFDVLGFPNALGKVVEGVADLPENTLVEGAPEVFNVLKLEDGADVPLVLSAKGIDVGADGPPKTLGDGFSED
jgi:hypothetical protein